MRMTIRWMLIMVAAMSISLGWIGIHSVAQPISIKKIAILLDIKEAIGPATQDFIHRGFQNARDQQASIILLRIDTPGGLSQSMRGIIQDILASPIPVIAYVAPSGARAASAGTYILYASHVAAMAPGTNLGAATPVSIGAPTAAPEKNKKSLSAEESKAINDAKAYIRSLAQLRDRNVNWAEKSVAEAASLSAEEALKLHVINFVAKDIPDLLQQANGMSIQLRDEKFILNTSGLTLQTIQPDWRTKFLSIITDPTIAYILLMIGFYGLFFEFANPGFVAPGVIGGIALLLALYAFQLLPINYAGLALILLGLAFFVAEAFMPSFGILGIGGVISFVVGSIFLVKTEAIGYSLPMYLIIVVAVVTAAFFLVVLNLVIRSRRRPIVSGREAIIGRMGEVTVSEHHIWVTIEGERWQCKSEMPLKNGQKVIVERIEGLICIVKPVEK